MQDWEIEQRVKTKILTITEKFERALVDLKRCKGWEDENRIELLKEVGAMFINYFLQLVNKYYERWWLKNKLGKL